MLKVTITIPSTMNNGNPVEDRDQVVNNVCSGMSACFDGCTLVDGVGHWNDANGNMVSENVTVATSYVTGEAVNTAVEKATRIAEYLKGRCQQDCVLVTVEPVNTVMFV
jgi:hypothetical protein